jgi:hypothetical protein
MTTGKTATVKQAAVTQKDVMTGAIITIRDIFINQIVSIVI